MENEIVWYLNFDWSMVWVCIIAVVVHILYLENKGAAKKHSWKNYVFYLLSSILVLSFISEVADYVISTYASISISVQSSIKHFLAAVSGLGGGYIVTGLINKFQKEE